MDNNKKIKSNNRRIIDTFIDKKAVNKKNSIFYDDINIDISDGEKKYLLNNLIKDEFIKLESDRSMWFDKYKWDKTVNKLSNIYLLILIAPLFVTAIVFILLKKFL